MDQIDRPFPSLFLTLLVVVVCLAPGRALSAEGASWTTSLNARLLQIDADFPGELGVYVKDLRTGESVGLREMEPWYLASTVKIAVAITLLEAVDAGQLTLDQRVELQPLDYVDGAGDTNRLTPGTDVSVRYLFEQMLIHSDNTATDVLLRLLGTDAVNVQVARSVGFGVGRITTLADVRRYAYSEFHPSAMSLTPRGFFAIKGAGEGDARVDALAEVLNMNRADFYVPDLDAAFERYYATGLNSAPLDQYSGLLESVARGEVLSPASGALLLATLTRVETGVQRVKAGLPASVRFAHKTGTQHRRACDMGIAIPTGRVPAEGVLIAVCARGSDDLAAAEAAMRALGDAVTESGVLH
ncbi:serine hydrolase [Saccharospirillum mangrovi]|uniref:serine hydrolase n=1 Tax=Saccharospirillum mangrovi TaxID=2161747 RepID=UPI000D39A9B3|nr:serine hydrolase [Saccharospirillum mangrovi]